MNVRVQLMGSYLIYIDEKRVESLTARSPKGAALLQLLILHEGRPVPTQRLLKELWPEYTDTDTKNSLKTLVSRLRAALNGMAEGLGDCIASSRGAYRWQDLSGVRVDLLELADLFRQLRSAGDDAALREQFRRILVLYQGDLALCRELEEGAAWAQDLHTQYLQAVCRYTAVLREAEEYNEIAAVCRTALEVDSFDDHLHMELMDALVNLDRVRDAVRHFDRAAALSSRYLGAAPSNEMYARLAEAERSRDTLKFNLDRIRNDLTASQQNRGAFVCEYGLFREIFNLQMRNLERLGTTMFLGIIMVGDADDSHLEPIRKSGVMDGLIDLVQHNLRRGDIVTRFSETVVALLLPTVNYETGSMVLERLRQVFYKRYPDLDIPFHSRLGMLGDERPEGPQGRAPVQGQYEREGRPDRE